ncbi:MAG TPA: histidine kinase [Luteimicrobium sp.]|nr:histidine kinase [Luteimicrobium sp.]
MPVTERLRLTALAGGFALAMVPALALAVLTAVAIPLVLVTVGVPLLGVLVPATARLTAAHRRADSALLGVPVGVEYADTAGAGPLARLGVWARDGARWRDQAFCWFSATGGFVLSVLPVALLVAPVVHVVLALALGRETWLWLALVSVPVAIVAWWFATPALVRARLTVERGLLDQARVPRLERRVGEVEGSRADSLDLNAAEIRRIERDLHDGAQARIAAAGMSAGLAEKLLRTDPDAAAELLREVQTTTVDALEDLRSLVRSIHPPVLADRGLAGAVETLALSVPLPVTVELDVPRLPAPVESATYFAVAELLANVVKHAHATRARVAGSHDGARLVVRVTDDGQGGADADGSGLTGIRRRLGAFDGTLRVDSPLGGPTEVTLEVPCPTP